MPACSLYKQSETLTRSSKRSQRSTVEDRLDPRLQGCKSSRRCPRLQLWSYSLAVAAYFLVCRLTPNANRINQAAVPVPLQGAANPLSVCRTVGTNCVVFGIHPALTPHATVFPPRHFRRNGVVTHAGTVHADMNSGM